MAFINHPLLTAVKPILDAVGAQLITVDDARISDIALEWEGEIIAAVRLPSMTGALDRLIYQVERELGAPLTDLSRHDKQNAVRMLDLRGAFTLRRAVEDVADAMGVSRITVYNYLNSLHR
jgi:hypothetical protein